MFSRSVLAATAAVAVVAAFSQPSQAQTTAPSTTVAAPATAQGADARKLIGRNIQNPQNETIGEINSVLIGADGKIDSVLVGVGGFLNMGEREVALRWSDLQVSQNGDKVVVNMTKDQLKGLPEYKYRDAKQRGTIFSDTAPAMNAVAPAAGTTAKPTATSTVAATAPVTGNTLIGASVRNMQNENIGTVDDLVVGADGKISAAVVSVGGFLGMGTRYVTLDWSALTVARDGNTIVVKTNATKDALKNMPEYKYQRVTG